MSKYFYQPIAPFYVNQYFGENKICIDPTNTKIIGCDGNNPPEGYRSIYGPRGHQGIDLRAYHGQEVYCAQAGVVDEIDTDPRTGLDVRIKTEIDGRTFIHIYEHLLGYQHKVGDRVETGQLIGWADNTGYSSGDHLHFEIREVINGRGISIDPLTVMEPIFAKEILKINNSLKWIAEQVALLMDRFASRIRS